MKNWRLLFLILGLMLPLGAFGTLSHDSAGRLEWETAASDSCTAVIRYTYDAAGRLSKTEKGLRKGDSVTEISGSSVTRDYAYDVHGWKVKTVTGIPMKLARGAAETTDISTPYYGAASSDVIKTPGGVVVARTKYTETIHYADGAVPRYNGTPSARDLTQGGRYDYRYDALDRLVAADYTPPSGKPDTDFSTEYTYDILSRPTSIRRHGVVDVDGTDEVFGLLDNLTLTYDGATLSTVKSIITDETGRDYYGRTGFAKGTYMASAPVEYNAAGRLVKDTGRMLSLVRYNTMGLPVLYSMSTDMTGNPPRQERSYDATGMKRRQTDYGAVRGQIAKTADRRYMESFTFNADTLERIEFNGGYFDGQGKAHFLFTDWQGNVTMTTDAGRRLEQHIGYYPYGEPWREPAGQHAKLFAGKERVTGVPGGDYDFGPRGYRATTGLWDSWDIHAADYAMWSPWMYCGGNPIRFVDPTGKIPFDKSVEHKRIGSRFGMRKHPITGNMSFHGGIDLPTNGTGHDVHAIADGTVKKIGWNANKVEGKTKGYGRYVVVEHANGYESLYAHLEKDGVAVSVGDFVSENDVIAKSGNTGASTGPHLHIEIGKGDVLKQQNKIDPASIPDLQQLIQPDNKEYSGGELAPVTVYGEAPDKPKAPVIKIPEIEVDLPITIPET